MIRSVAERTEKAGGLRVCLQVRFASALLLSQSML